MSITFKVVDLATSDMILSHMGKVMDSHGNFLRGRLIPFYEFIGKHAEVNAFVSDYFGIYLVFSDKILILKYIPENISIVCSILTQLKDPKNSLQKEQLIFLRLFL